MFILFFLDSINLFLIKRKWIVNDFIEKFGKRYRFSLYNVVLGVVFLLWGINLVLGCVK